MSLSRFTYKGFWLEGKPLILVEKSCKAILNHTRLFSSENEYTSTPMYPPILDLSPKSVYIRERDHQLDKIKCLGTIEEKLIGINMPRYYGWSSLMLKEGNYPFNFMPFVQHITRTDFIEVDKFPFSNVLSSSEIENALNKIRPQLQNALILEMTKRRHHHEFDGSAEMMEDTELSDVVTKGVVQQINRILSANLVQHAPHLYETDFDIEPRIEAFWRVGGFHPDNKTYEERKKEKEKYEKELKKNRYAKKKIEEEPEDLVGHFIQYQGEPILQLRCSNPLRPLEPQPISSKSTPDDSAPSTPIREPDLSCVPQVRYDPGFYGLEKIRRHGTNIPGFWPGDPNQFGLLSFHSCGHLLGRPPSFGDEELIQTIRAQAILAGYSWLLGQANYQGFSTFHDVTYPLATTTIVTDGRIFSFFASQLNTLLFHDEFMDINPKVNVCYGLPTVELFEKIEGDEIVGWNDDALSLLVQAYLNTPAEREGVDLRPYVDKDMPLIQDIQHEERRAWLHARFLKLTSNRPRIRLDPEIYDWEEIYKIKFEKRPMDPRRKYFEIGTDPFKRRLNDHQKIYVPKRARDPDNPKKRRLDDFYPDC